MEQIFKILISKFFWKFFLKFYILDFVTGTLEQLTLNSCPEFWLRILHARWADACWWLY